MASSQIKVDYNYNHLDPGWDEAPGRGEPNDVRFRDSDELGEYVERVQDIINMMMEDLEHNSVTNFVTFYNRYDKQEGRRRSISGFLDAEPLHHESITTQGLSGTSLTVHFLRVLDDNLARTKFACFSDRWFFAAGIKTPNGNPPASVAEGTFKWPADYTELLAAALHFAVGERKGYIVVEFEYGLYTPIIFMADNQPPHTVSLGLRVTYLGTKTQQFQYLPGCYALMSLVDPISRDEQFRIYRLGKMFKRPDLVEKRRQSYPHQVRITYEGDLTAYGYYFDMINIPEDYEGRCQYRFFRYHDGVATVGDYTDAEVRCNPAGMVQDPHHDKRMDLILNTLGSSSRRELASVVKILETPRLMYNITHLSNRVATTLQGLWSGVPLS